MKLLWDNEARSDLSMQLNKLTIAVITMSLVASVQAVLAQSGQNLPDIFPYQSLPLYEGPQSSQMTDRDGDIFSNEILAKDGVSVVEFMLPTCLACNPTAKELNAMLSQFHGKVRYLRLNINHNLKLSYRYDIPKVPAVLVFNNGSLVKKFAVYNNAQNADLAQTIASQLAVPTPAVAAKTRTFN